MKKLVAILMLLTEIVYSNDISCSIVNDSFNGYSDMFEGKFIAENINRFRVEVNKIGDGKPYFEKGFYIKLKGLESGNVTFESNFMPKSLNGSVLKLINSDNIKKQYLLFDANTYSLITYFINQKVLFFNEIRKTGSVITTTSQCQ